MGRDFGAVWWHSLSRETLKTCHGTFDGSFSRSRSLKAVRRTYHEGDSTNRPATTRRQESVSDDGRSPKCCLPDVAIRCLFLDDFLPGLSDVTVNDVTKEKTANIYERASAEELSDDNSCHCRARSSSSHDCSAVVGPFDQGCQPARDLAERRLGSRSGRPIAGSLQAIHSPRRILPFYPFSCELLEVISGIESWKYGSLQKTTTTV